MEEDDAAVIESLEHVDKSSVQSWVDGELPCEEDKKKRKASRVWYGKSTREDKDDVKQLCRGTEEGPSNATFEFERKLWGTFQLSQVPMLIVSGKWHPDGLPSHLKPFAAVEAWRRLEKKRVAAAKRLQEKVRADAARERADEAKREESAAERLQMQRRMKEVMLAIPETTEADYAEAAAMGLSRELVDATAQFPWLGPRGGPSAWKRVKRWFHLKSLTSHLPTGKSRQQVIQELVDEHERRSAAQQSEMKQQQEATARRQAEEEKRRLREATVGDGEATKYEPFDSFKLRFFSGDVAATTATTTDAVTFQYVRRTPEEETQWQRANGVDVVLNNARLQAADIRRPVLLPCPHCGHAPRFVQFLDCRCRDEWFDWIWCIACHRNAHPNKLPCQCMSVAARNDGGKRAVA